MANNDFNNLFHDSNAENMNFNNMDVNLFQESQATQNDQPNTGHADNIDSDLNYTEPLFNEPEPVNPDPRIGLTDDQKAEKKASFLKRMQMTDSEFEMEDQRIQKENPNHFLDYTNDYGGIDVNGNRTMPVYTPEGDVAIQQAAQQSQNKYDLTPNDVKETKRKEFMQRMQMDETEMKVLNDDLSKDGEMVDYLSDAGGVTANGDRDVPVFDGQGTKLITQITSHQIPPEETTAQQPLSNNPTQPSQQGQPLSPNNPAPEKSALDAYHETFRDDISPDKVNHRLDMMAAKVDGVNPDDMKYVHFTDDEKQDIQNFQDQYANASEADKLSAAYAEMDDVFQPEYLKETQNELRDMKSRETKANQNDNSSVQDLDGDLEVDDASYDANDTMNSDMSDTQNDTFQFEGERGIPGQQPSSDPFDAMFNEESESQSTNPDPFDDLMHDNQTTQSEKGINADSTNLSAKGNLFGNGLEDLNHEIGQQKSNNQSNQNLFGKGLDDLQGPTGGLRL